MRGYISDAMVSDTRLSPRDKLIFYEITSRVDEHGICTKNNVYFAKLLDCSKGTISVAMTTLRDNGYIYVIIERDQNQTFKKRYIIPKPMYDFQVEGNDELQEAIYDFQIGVRGISDDATDGGGAKAKYEKSTPIITSNNIRYISNKVIEKTPLNPLINNRQSSFLTNIVTDFYTEKHKQFPQIVKDKWWADENLMNGSINTLFDLITKDKWEDKVVRNVIRWATNDSFWRNNLLSLRTLRKKANNEQTKFANLYLKYEG